MTIFRAPSKVPRHAEDAEQHRSLLADAVNAVLPLARMLRFASRKILSWADVIYVDEEARKVGLCANPPLTDLHIKTTTPTVRMEGTGATWQVVVNASTGRLTVVNTTTADSPVKIDPASANNLLRLGQIASDAVEVNGVLNLAQTSTAAEPTTTEYPTDGDVGIHHNTSSGDRFFVWNDGGTIYFIPLSAALPPPIPIALTAYDPEPARTAATYIHGVLNEITKAAALNSGSPITFNSGIGKLLIVVNAGSDTAGTITITGDTIDRETGAKTTSDTDSITVAGLTTDSTATDSNGNSKWGFANAYITSKWFSGATNTISLTTTDLTLTEVDVYHISFEQFNDITPLVKVVCYDINLLVTNANADFDSYLYAVEVSGDTAEISLLADLHVGADGEPAQAGEYYRLRKGNIDKELDGATDGIWTETHYNATANIEDVTLKVWAELEQYE